MILGIIWIRSSELSRLSAVTAAVAASTTEVIWELVRELESVLLVLRDDTLACLELLEEERLALSSLITLEARVVVVVFSSVVVVSSSLLFLAHEIIVRLKSKRERIMYKILCIVLLHQLKKEISLNSHIFIPFSNLKEMNYM
jgi:hypothetical protein